MHALRCRHRAIPPEPTDKPPKVRKHLPLLIIPSSQPRPRTTQRRRPQRREQTLPDPHRRTRAPRTVSERQGDAAARRTRHIRADLRVGVRVHVERGEERRGFELVFGACDGEE